MRSGTSRIRPNDEAEIDPLLGHYADGDHVFQWHMDTFDLPDGAERLATGDRVLNQAYRVGERAWGVQWHFEIDRDELEQWLVSFERADGPLETSWGKSAEAVREEADRFQADHEMKGRAVFARFAALADTLR